MYDVNRSQPPYLTVFLLDGLNQAMFQEELKAKNLPNIERLIDNGVYIKNGITCFPSMTGYCYYALTTGYDSSHSGITGARWFSRGNHSGNFRGYFGGATNAFVNHDTNPDTPTLFEAVDGWSWAGNSMFYRGATIKEDTSFQNGMAKLKGKWWVPTLLGYVPLVNRYLAPSFEQAEDDEMQKVVRGLSQVPKVQWCVFSAPDGCMHTNGFGNRYRDVLRKVDSLIGKYIEESRILGLERYRTYAIVSDHGGTNVTKNINSADYLTQHGLRAYRGFAHETDSKFERTLDFFAEYDVAVLVNGDTMNHLYVKHPGYQADEAWHHRVPLDLLQNYPLYNSKKTVNIISILLAMDGIELVSVWDNPTQSVHVYSPNGGKSVITMDSSGKLLYQIIGLTDPLEYVGAVHSTKESADIAQSNISHTESEWMKATSDTKFPYGAVRLFQLMSSPQGSDIVITAKENFDLGKDYEKYIGSFTGGHGGLRSDQLRVPYILSGWGIKKGVVMDAARAEDIGATLIHLFASENLRTYKGKKNYKYEPTDVKPFMTFPNTPEFQDPVKNLDVTELFQGKILEDALLPHLDQNST